MMADLTFILPILAMACVCITSLGLLLITNWRWTIIALAIQYAGVFLLIVNNWPVTLALVKLIAGWMAGAIIGLAISGLPGEYQIGLSAGRSLREKTSPRINFSYLFFRIFAAGIFALVIIALSPALTKVMPNLTPEQSYGAFFLIGFGVLHLCLTTEVLPVILGLLTTLSGFEVIYAVVESSSMVTALLATITLGIALVGAYMLTASYVEAGQ
jgi:hypothetical protein